MSDDKLAELVLTPEQEARALRLFQHSWKTRHVQSGRRAACEIIHLRDEVARLTNYCLGYQEIAQEAQQLRDEVADLGESNASLVAEHADAVATAKELRERVRELEAQDELDVTGGVDRAVPARNMMTARIIAGRFAPLEARTTQPHPPEQPATGSDENMNHWPECEPPDEVGARGNCICDGKPKMSDTPKTDAAANGLPSGGIEWVDADFAREQERRIAELEARITQVADGLAGDRAATGEDAVEVLRAVLPATGSDAT